MRKILVVCHGNICRSPMAMFVMRDMVKKQGLERSFRIDSAATSREEIGNPCYPPARRKLAKEGLSGEGHAARKMVREDYENYDYLIGMDDENLYDMYAICEGNDPYSGGWRRRDFSRERTDIQIPRIYDSVKRRGERISLLLDYTKRPGEVADPWYTGNFDATWRDVTEGCAAFLEYLHRERYDLRPDGRKNVNR